MSTPDQPSTPPLTRRQLRELRNTASNPIVTPEDAEKARQEAAAAAASTAPQPEPAAPAEEPAGPESAPASDESMSEVPAASEPIEDAAAPEPEAPSAPVSRRLSRRSRVRPPRVAEPETVEPEVAEPEAAEPEAAEPEGVEPEAVEPEAAASEPAVAEPASDEETPTDESEDVESEDVESEDVEPPVVEPEIEVEEEERAKGIAPDLGSHLLEVPRTDVELPASFDNLLTRGSGSSSAPNALILSENPDTGSLSVPITTTGELLITGSYALPESFGSTGSAPGTADGKDVDAALIDGELPPASSPTPIAASSAISTIKSAEDIIRPPAPEKGSKLMMSLAITAGVLAVALAGVLILALVNGVF